MKKILAAVLSVLLLVLAVVLVFQNQRQENRRAQQIAHLVAEAKPYYEEIEAIRAELEKREREIKLVPPVSSGIIGFLPTSAEDVSTVKKLSAGYDFTPLMILDCAMDADTLQDIAQMSIHENFNLVLAGMTFDRQILEKADALRAILPEYGYAQEVGFFLRYSSDTAENREILGQHGYRNLIRYNSALQSGVDGQGITCLSYGFATSPDTIDSFVSQVAAAHSYTVIALDFATIHGMVNGESFIADLLDAVERRVSAGEMKFADISEAFHAVAEADRIYKERREEYEQYKLEQQARMDELTQIISEIYRHWNE